MFRGSAYCQLIREENKQKCLAFVEEYKEIFIPLSAWFNSNLTGDSAVEKEERPPVQSQGVTKD